MLWMWFDSRTPFHSPIVTGGTACNRRSPFFLPRQRVPTSNCSAGTAGHSTASRVHTALLGAAGMSPSSNGETVSGYVLMAEVASKRHEDILHEPKYCLTDQCTIVTLGEVNLTLPPAITKPGISHVNDAFYKTRSHNTLEAQMPESYSTFWEAKQHTPAMERSNQDSSHPSDAYATFTDISEKALTPSIEIEPQ